jgi:hypothetical protein
MLAKLSEELGLPFEPVQLSSPPVEAKAYLPDVTQRRWYAVASQPADQSQISKERDALWDENNTLQRQVSELLMDLQLRADTLTRVELSEAEIVELQQRLSEAIGACPPSCTCPAVPVPTHPCTR